MVEKSAQSGTNQLLARFSKDAESAIQEICKLGDFDSVQDAIKQALADELFLQKKKRNGWTILLKKGNKYKEVIWPEK